MNQKIQSKEESLSLQVSELVCLFESKGYECREEKNVTNTLYIFKADRHSYIDYNLHPNPNWQVVRSPNADWL